MKMSKSKMTTSHFRISLALAVIYVQVAFGLKYYYGDGSYFIGDVDDFGRPSGHGTFHNTSGILEYDGEFLEGHPHGYGTWYGADGTVFKGQFRYGRSNGKAINLKPNGDKIEGEFLNLRPHGNIVLTKAIMNRDEKDLSSKGKGGKEVEHKQRVTDNVDINASLMVNKSALASDPLVRNNKRQTPKGKIHKIEGDFRSGMAHGNINMWYHNPEEKLIQIEGVYRMGEPHGYFRFVDENATVLTEAKYLNGEPLESVNGRSNIKSKPYLFKVPRKIIL